MNKEFMDLRRQWRKQKFFIGILIVIGITLGLSRVAYAASNNTLQIQFTWAYGVLSAILLGLIIYLFVVFFQPERF
ncbi:potassium-transporting ATPase subunit F [Nostoc sp. FACHB-280]|uniref:potassium-transporting ATPase subunit F n=1 Tax=Nostoc sp. FACHB-280 TaxID=2692839 RepID=UPI00168B4F06|nr:potassium-transporting ATPase subunit F [Nostoc sp. FACHB-280]MBD2493933.1 potassium-transporting ATPase subunit F [Nostoc sp. FACHB-280]